MRLLYPNARLERELKADRLDVEIRDRLWRSIVLLNV
jgi:hypothetical protein